ncbi:MAG: Ldh family oxidoreductase, partial [Enterobacteriaceae bacterium]
LPEGWGLDADGEPSTDAESVMQGAMLTFGGYKGSALAAMIELLAGPLIGELSSVESLAFDADSGASPFGGELIIAIDPAAFLGEQQAAHLARAEAMFSALLAQGARLPGQRRYQQRTVSVKEGVSIPRTLYEEIKQLSDAG